MGLSDALEIFNLTSNYGKRIDPLSGESDAFHSGIDLSAPEGTDVPSFVGGFVSYAGEGRPGTGYGNYGNTVAVTDYSGKTHVYAHLSSINVGLGDFIGEGGVLGGVGSTGKSTGNHLHYEVRTGVFGSDIDPSSFLESFFADKDNPFTTQAGESKTVVQGKNDNDLTFTQNIVRVVAIFFIIVVMSFLVFKLLPLDKLPIPTNIMKG